MISICLEAQLTYSYQRTIQMRISDFMVSHFNWCDFFSRANTKNKTKDFFDKHTLLFTYKSFAGCQQLPNPKTVTQNEFSSFNAWNIHNALNTFVSLMCPSKTKKKWFKMYTVHVWMPQFLRTSKQMICETSKIRTCSACNRWVNEENVRLYVFNIRSHRKRCREWERNLCESALTNTSKNKGEYEIIWQESKTDERIAECRMIERFDNTLTQYVYYV